MKGILKYLVQSVGAYQDAKSRRAVLKIIQILTKAFPAVVVKNTAIVLSSKSSLQTNVVNARYKICFIVIIPHLLVYVCSFSGISNDHDFILHFCSFFKIRDNKCMQ